MFKDTLKSDFELADQSNDLLINDNNVAKFRRRYSHIRVYHACRPEDVTRYYDKGLLLSDNDAQIDRFRLLFLDGQFPELTEDMLQYSIKELAGLGKDSDDDGELCLALDDKWIINQCGHYLIYGGEYLGNLVSQLPIENIDKYRSVLRGIGKPTFLEINLPNRSEYVSDSNIGELIHDMITEWTYCLTNSRSECCPLDFTISIREPLHSKHICSHYYPKKIPDPNMHWKVYDVETGKYEAGGVV